MNIERFAKEWRIQLEFIIIRISRFINLTIDRFLFKFEFVIKLIKFSFLFLF